MSDVHGPTTPPDGPRRRMIAWHIRRMIDQGWPPGEAFRWAVEWFDDESNEASS